MLGPSSSSFALNNSKTGGTTGTVGSSRTTTEGQTSQQSETVGYSETVHKRPLLNPDEVGRVFGDSPTPRVLVLRSGKQPLALFRRPYFAVRMFDGFHDPHPHHPPPRMLNHSQVEQSLENQDEQRILEEDHPSENLKTGIILCLIASAVVLDAVWTYWSTIVWVCQWLICIAVVVGLVTFIAGHSRKPHSAAEGRQQ